MLVWRFLCSLVEKYECIYIVWYRLKVRVSAHLDGGCPSLPQQRHVRVQRAVHFSRAVKVWRLWWSRDVATENGMLDRVPSA